VAPSIDDLRKRYRPGRRKKDDETETPGRGGRGSRSTRLCIRCKGEGTVGGDEFSKTAEVRCPRCGGTGIDPDTPHEERRPRRSGTEVDPEDLFLTPKEREEKRKKRVDPKALADKVRKKTGKKYKIVDDGRGHKDAVLYFGKYSGSKVSHLVADEDGRSYLLWVLKEGFEDELKEVVVHRLHLEGYDPAERMSDPRGTLPRRPPF